MEWFGELNLLDFGDIVSEGSISEIDASSSVVYLFFSCFPRNLLPLHGRSPVEDVARNKF